MKNSTSIPLQKNRSAQNPSVSKLSSPRKNLSSFFEEISEQSSESEKPRKEKRIPQPYIQAAAQRPKYVKKELRVLINADLDGRDKQYKGKVIAVDKKYLKSGIENRAMVLKNICNTYV